MSKSRIVGYWRPDNEAVIANNFNQLVNYGNKPIWPHQAKPAIAHLYRSFLNPLNSGPPTSFVSSSMRLDITPMITWEPWLDGDKTNLLRRIVAGDMDTYIDMWTTAIGNSFFGDKDIVLRFAHEMNGSWYPWGGNDPDLYLAAWQHVRTFIVKHPSRRIKMMWCPNIHYPGSIDFRRYYPGDANCDLVGLDGYNWGSDAETGRIWSNPLAIFAESMEMMAELTDRPVWICETACPADRRKAQWIRQLDEWSVSDERIAAVVWFDESKECDWRIDSSKASEKAFKAMLR